MTASASGFPFQRLVSLVNISMILYAIMGDLPTEVIRIHNW
jgi:hypothetical protein